MNPIKNDLYYVLMMYAGNKKSVLKYCRENNIKWGFLNKKLKEQARRVRIVNGCGGKLFGWLLPKTMYEACCNQHDWNYFFGGREVDRAKADWQFFIAMLSDASRLSGLASWRHIALAFLFYTAVRMFGFFCFNYCDSSPTEYKP